MRSNFDQSRELISKAQVTVDYVFEHLNDGHLWYMVGVIPALAAAAKVYRGFVTPAVGVVYMRAARIFSTKAACLNILYEDTPFTDGTTVIDLNRNRNATTISPVVIKKLVTPGTLGTQVAWIGAGIAGNAGQGVGGQGSEAGDDLALKKNTSYVFEATNIGAEATDIYYLHAWHIEEDA